MRFFLLIISTCLLFTNCQSQENHHCPYNYNNHKSGDKCGFVEVPRNWDDGNSEITKLNYLLIKSQSKNRKEDPVIFIQGGPGGSVLQLVNTYSKLIIDSDRDFIIYDQRGIGFSEELCPKLNEELITILSKDLSIKEEIQNLHQALSSCKDFIKNDSRQFSTVTNAKDLEALRIHLGYKQLNLFGGSYGTRLGLKYMELYPENIRSSILSGLFPPEIRMYNHLLSNFENALNRVFESCEKDSNCNYKYPNLKSEFLNIYKKLKTSPITIQNRASNFVLNQQDILLFFHQMLYSQQTINKIPEFINALKFNDKDYITRTINTFLPRITTINLAVYYAVMSSDEGDFNNSLMLKNDSRNLTLSNNGLSLFSADPEIIKSWPNKKINDNTMIKVSSKIPTLLVSGDFDPVTPISNGNQVKNHLKNSQHLIFKNSGHVPLNQCFFSLGKSFLDNPKKTIENKCYSEGNPFNWN